LTIQLSKEHKEQMLNDIKNFFYYERSEEIGDLAAENMLDFLVKEIGPYFYNQGVKDSKVMVEQKRMNVEEDILSLEKPLIHRKR
jgi:uncharacterized protein (DUF2164 family)